MSEQETLLCLKKKEMPIWTWTIILFISAPNYPGKHLGHSPAKKCYLKLNILKEAT